MGVVKTRWDSRSSRARGLKPDEFKDSAEIEVFALITSAWIETIKTALTMSSREIRAHHERVD